MTEPLLPQDLEAEEYVLGAMMISPHAIDLVMDEHLSANDFYRASHGKIFTACLALYGEGETVDVLTVVDRLDEQGVLVEVGGRDRLREIATLVPAASNAGHHARIVRDAAIRRGLTSTGYEIQQLGAERGAPTRELLDRAEGLVFDLAQSRSTSDFVSIRDTVEESYARIQDAFENGRTAVTGVPTGFGHLDGLTQGLQPGNLIVLAARPSMGKTALALAITAHVAVRIHLPVAVFTLEMSRTEITDRLLAAEAAVESTKIRTGHLDGDEWGRLASASAKLADAPLILDDSATLTAMELRSKARKAKLRYPDLGLVVVDYLQLMSSGGRSENRVQDVSLISRSLKVLARELNVPVIALSQLSRKVEERHDKRPILSDLRESGAIEQDSDLVAFIYRDEYYNPEDTDQQGIAELNIAKHRNGPTGMVKLSFVKRTVRFSSLPS